MTEHVLPRCCADYAGDRPRFAKHLVAAHGTAVPRSMRLSRAMLIADRAVDGLPQDAGDLWLFRLPGGVEPEGSEPQQGEAHANGLLGAASSDLRDPLDGLPAAVPAHDRQWVEQQAAHGTDAQASGLNAGERSAGVGRVADPAAALREDLVQSIERLAAGAIAERNLFALPYDQAVDAFRRAYLTSALTRHRGERGQTARAIGMSLKGLLYATRTLGVEVPSPRTVRRCSTCNAEGHDVRNHDTVTAATA